MHRTCMAHGALPMDRRGGDGQRRRSWCDAMGHHAARSRDTAGL